MFWNAKSDSDSFRLVWNKSAIPVAVFISSKMKQTRKRKVQNPKKSQTNEHEDSQAKNQHPMPTASTSKCPKFSDNKRPSSQDIRKYINANSQDFADENIDIET